MRKAICLAVLLFCAQMAYGQSYFYGNSSSGGASGANQAFSNLTSPTAINTTTLTFAGAGGLTSTNGNDIDLIVPTSSNFVNVGTTGSASRLTFASYIVSGHAMATIQNDYAAVGDAASQIYLSNSAGLTYFMLGDNISNLNYVGTNHVQLDDGAGHIKPVHYDATTCRTGSGTPANCAAATVGTVAVPAGVNPTLVILTNQVTATSSFLLTIDESATGLSPSITCNTSLGTLVQPVVTARSVGVSFTIQMNTTLVTNPACVDWFLIN